MNKNIPSVQFDKFLRITPVDPAPRSENRTIFRSQRPPLYSIPVNIYFPLDNLIIMTFNTLILLFFGTYLWDHKYVLT